jgi:siroheme synthase-like protein
MLNIEEKKIVVIGGGSVALEKIRKLIEFGAVVEVLSLAILSSILKLGHQVHCTIGPYTKDHIRNAFLVISATNDSIINRQVYKDCKDLGILCNVVDQPNLCDVVFTSALKRGQLIFSVSTSGQSPMLGQNIIAKLAQEYDYSWEEKIGLLGAIRTILKQREKDSFKRNKMLKAIINKDIDTLRRILEKLTINGG